MMSVAANLSNGAPFISLPLTGFVGDCMSTSAMVVVRVKRNLEPTMFGPFLGSPLRQSGLLW